MNGFFNSENWFWKSFGRIADYFLLSVCWLLTSIPVLTAGTSSIALYDTVAHCVCMNESGMLRRYFGTFRKELLRGIVLTVVWAVIAFALNMGYQIIYQNGAHSSFWGILSIVYFCSLFIPLGILCWTVSLESRFVYSFGQLCKTALTFTFLHLPQTAAIVVLFVVVLNLVINFPFLVMVLPGLMVHLQAFFIEKVFHKYMPRAEADSIEE